ncbi:MAG TPA: MFS transporter [Xanthobacteraceae bacterium]|jgi:putative MFS transporter|nr:MFS transporter [Xanthobacteraceae bacterium]
MEQIQGVVPAAQLIAARLDRLPVSSWHIRVRLILGIATFFDAMDLLAISFAVPAIAGPWHLSPQQIGMVISAAFAGQLVGALSGGWAAEMFGRLRTVVMATALFSVMSLACAFAWDAESLAAFRFVQGIGLGAEVPVATTYIIELARERGRGRFYILYELVFVIGLIAAALLGTVLVPRFGWQSMFFVGGLPAILALMLMRLLPESPRWLANQGRIAEAEAIVSQIEQRIAASGQKLPPVQAPATLSLSSAAPPRRRWLEMLDSAYRRRTLGVWAMWFCCYSTVYGLVTWMPTLYRTEFNVPLSTALSYGLVVQVAGIIGAALCAFTIDRIGRRIWFSGALLCGGATLLILAALGVTSATMLLAFVSISMFFMSAVAIGLNLYTAEIYPTRIRAFASAVGGAWQRIAAATGPNVVAYLLTGSGLTAVFSYFGVIALVGAAIAAAYTVETKEQPLETASAA